MKRLIDEKGSTLMMVVITIAILSVLGMALLAMSLMNINMKYNDTRIKKTLYYSESGIDQVYAKVGEFVENAIDDALLQTNTDLQGELERINNLLSSDTASEIDLYITKAVNGDFVIDTEALEVYADQQFRYHFKYYLNNHYDDGGIDFITTDSGADITIGRIDKFLNLSGTGETYIFNDVTASFVYKDNTEKVITTDIIIRDEIGAYPIYTKEKHVSLPDNPIWQQALVAQDNIKFSGDAVTINGDVFGYGTKPTSTQNDSALNYGGIIVDGSCKVEVNASNLISRAYIQLGKNATTEASLNINNGLVYGDALVIQKKGSGLSGEMNIRGNVYSRDDLEINGNGGRIAIDGSYYGYTDGSDSVDSVTHDLSSAIVINADVESAGFGLEIEPLKDGSGNTMVNSALDYHERTEGILIGGTAYVNVSNAFRYQTGESVSLAGNFIAYTWAYNQEDVETIGQSNIFLNPPYNLYKPEDNHEERVQERMLSDNIDWQTIGDIPFANGVISGEGWNLHDRMAYFVAFKEFVDSGDTFIKKSKPSTIKLEDYIFTTGLQLSPVSSTRNDYVYNANHYNNSELDYLRVSIRDDYRYLLNEMTLRGGGNSGEKLSEIEDVWVEDAVEPMKKIQPGNIDNINAINKYTKLDTQMIQLKTLSESKTPMPYADSDGYSYIPSNDVVYIDSATSEPLHIYPDTYSGVMEKNALKSSAMKGVIVTNSDVYIHGDLTFYGPIISGGNIFCDDGHQYFYNDLDQYTNLRKYLMDLIYNNNTLYDLFFVNNYAGPLTPSIDLGEISYTQVDSTEAYEPQNNSAQNYFEYISFRYWKVIK